MRTGIRRVCSVRLGSRRVRSSAFGQFPCTLVFVGFAIRVRYGGRCQVLFRWRLSVSFGCVRAIPVHPCESLGCYTHSCVLSTPLPPRIRRFTFTFVHYRAPWGSFPCGPYTCALVFVPALNSLWVIPAISRRRMLVRVQFPYAFGVVELIRVAIPIRNLHPFPCALGVSLVRSPVRSGCCWFRSGEPWGSSGSFRCIRTFHERDGGRRIRSGAFGMFPCALVVVEFVLLRSVHSGSLRGLSGAFRYVLFIPVRVRNVDYPALWESSG